LGLDGSAGRDVPDASFAGGGWAVLFLDFSGDVLGMAGN